MKHTKKVSAFVGACVLVTAFFVGIRLQSMKPTEFTLKSRSRRRGVQPVQQQEQPRYKSETVWVKTSDNILMEVPRWQIDQMKVLQILLVHQKGGNSKENPADASMVTSEQLASIQKALQNASDLEKFRKFYGSLSDDQQKSLLADA